MKRKKVIRIYRDRFEIDKLFFRDDKQEMELADFHIRKLKALASHILCFLSYTLISLISLI